MNWDDAITAFGTSEELPVEAMQWVLDEWATTGPQCRSLVAAYVDGIDLSERTEQSLYVVTHLLAEQQDTASFGALCRLAADRERCDSTLGEDGVTATMPAILISTFDGDPAPLHRLAETEEADAVMRGEALFVLAYLTRTRQIPEAATYEYLAGLPARLQPQARDFVWFAWASAIALLGFAGQSARVEQVFHNGWIDPDLLNPALFWDDLRGAQADPHGMNAAGWDGLGPIGSAIEWLQSASDAAEEIEPAPMEPIRNLLRSVGRNDPCPCGSGKKYKKCCLAA
nr:DUF1186 domain-containing protein [Acidisphaera sp. L21]